MWVYSSMIFVLLMAIGVLCKRQPIQGSCGGLNNLDGINKVCDCENPCSKAIAAQKNAQPDMSNSIKVKIR